MSLLTATLAPHFSLTWTPQPDITVFELALCMPVVAMQGAYDVGSIKRWYEALPVAAQRHFEVEGAQQSELAASAPPAVGWTASL